MRKTAAALVAAFSSVAALAANQNVSDLSTLGTAFFFEGDTLTLPSGSYTMRGDAIATVADNVVTCRKSGYAALSDGSAMYALRVLPQAMPGGDVFYFNQTANEASWSSAGWVNVTRNTDRTVPNNENDIAFLYSNAPENEFDSFLIDVNVKVHGYVVALADEPNKKSKTQFKTTNGSSFTFCGTAAAPAYFRLSTLDNSEDAAVRVGQENGTGGKVLNIYIEGPRLEFDFCGDSAKCANPRQKTGLQLCSVIFNVDEGQTLAFVDDSKALINSKAVTDFVSAGNTSVGHVSGSGEFVVGLSGGFPVSWLKFSGDEFAGDVAVQSADWKGMVEFPGAGLTVFDAPNAGRKMLAIGYDNCSSNPGRSQIDVKSLTLDGGCVRIYRNYADGGNLTPWTEGATTDAEKAARLAVTNEIRKLVVKGDSAFYCECSYGTTRVRQHLILDEIEHDETGTLCFYDFNFRDKAQRTDVLHYDRVRGPGLAVYAAGRDPQPGDSKFVYKIIPWIACTANDNGFQVYNSWGSEMTFPALTNGVYGTALMSKGRTNLALQDAGEWDNVYFNQKGIGTRGTGLSADVTVNSLVYNTAETAPYPDNFILGEGRTLTIKSGGLIMGRSGRWLGCTQTSYFSKNGTVIFGDRAYVICDYGVPDGDSGREYNVIWSKMTAPYGLTKGGCGELVFAADQRGIDGDIAIGGGTLWLGHPANHRRLGWLFENQSGSIPVRGCVTDVEKFTLRPGAVLGIPSKGYDTDGNGEIGILETAVSRDAEISLTDNAAGTAKVEIALGADQTCMKLFINGESMPRGTYGASGSSADFIDDLHFAGTGVLTVRKDEAKFATVIIVR